MVAMLDSGSIGPGLSPGQGHCVVFLACTLSVSFSALVYKWALVNLLLGVTLQWTSIPFTEKQKNSQLLHVTEIRMSSMLMCHLVHMQTIGKQCTIIYRPPKFNLCFFQKLIKDMDYAKSDDRKPSINNSYCLQNLLQKVRQQSWKFELMFVQDTFLYAQMQDSFLQES